MYTHFTLRFGSLSYDQSTVALIRLCCKPSVYEVIQNKHYKSWNVGLNLLSEMPAKRTDKFEEKFKNNCTFGKYLI